MAVCGLAAAYGTTMSGLIIRPSIVSHEIHDQPRRYTWAGVIGPGKPWFQRDARERGAGRK